MNQNLPSGYMKEGLDDHIAYGGMQLFLLQGFLVLIERKLIA